MKVVLMTDAPRQWTGAPTMGQSSLADLFAKAETFVISSPPLFTAPTVFLINDVYHKSSTFITVHKSREKYI